MNTLKAGYSCVDATSALGASMDGYFHERYAEGVMDPLLLRCLALNCGEQTVLLMAIDTCEIKTEYSDMVRKHVSHVTDVPVEAIFFHATHVELRYLR